MVRAHICNWTWICTWGSKDTKLSYKWVEQWSIVFYFYPLFYVVHLFGALSVNAQFHIFYLRCSTSGLFLKISPSLEKLLLFQSGGSTGRCLPSCRKGSICTSPSALAVVDPLALPAQASFRHRYEAGPVWDACGLEVPYLRIGPGFLVLAILVFAIFHLFLVFILCWRFPSSFQAPGVSTPSLSRRLLAPCPS